MGAFFRAVEFECKCDRLDCEAPPMRPGFMAKIERLRELWGKPLIVTSGSRCHEHNAAIGGAENSQHLLGNAADLRISSYIAAESLKALAVKVGFGGIGIAKAFVHVDDGPQRDPWTYP